jgi:5-methylthioribose kinase
MRLTIENLFGYLESRGLLPPGADARCESPGEGNINWVQRVRGSDGASFIVKQARGSLERFPEYAAPPQRIALEARYYEVTAPYDTEHVRPGVLDFDPEHFVLILEDLGEAERLDEALSSGRDTASALQRLGRFLGAVHGATRDGNLAGEFENAEMQRLHGEHIFSLPYRENDFPLSPRLRERAREIWRDRELVSSIDASYERFLTLRGALVHGDVQPGNLLLMEARLVLIDAEIAHIGDPAFDAGTLLAHLLLAGLANPTLDAVELSCSFWEHYAGEHGPRGLPRPRWRRSRSAGLSA